MIVTFLEQRFKLLHGIIHYLLILASWIYSRRYYVVYIPLITFLWLYYEIKYTSPGCTFYSGKNATRLLSSCNFMFKSYRPPIYAFSCTLQWLYMRLFNNLELLSKLLNSNYFERLGFLRRPLYYWISMICNMIIKSPLFSHISTDNVFIAQREIIESFGRSPTILDWYLPPWLVNKCKNCHRPKPLSPFIKFNIHKSQRMLNNGSNFLSFVSSEKSFPYNYENDAQRHFYGKSGNLSENKSEDDNMSTTEPRSLSRFIPLKLAANPFSRFSFRNKHNSLDNIKLAQYALTESGKPRESNKHCDEFNFEDVDLDFDGSNDSRTPFNNSRDTNSYIQKVPSDYNSFADNSVTRGIILILPDYNMPYNICNQHAGCICDAWNNKSQDKIKRLSCRKCLVSLYKDAHSYNKETPCLSLTRLFIADALKAGFICVEIHLNVNLGLPIHIKGHWLGMTSYPFSIYGNSISDMDCAIGRIASRYPHLPIQCVGFSGGSNILIEYILRANDSRFMDKLNDEQKNSLLLFKTTEIVQNPFEGPAGVNPNDFIPPKSLNRSNSFGNSEQSSSSSSSDIENDQAEEKWKKARKDKKSRVKKVLSDKLKSIHSLDQIDQLDNIEDEISREVLTSRNKNETSLSVRNSGRNGVEMYKKKISRRNLLMKSPKINDKWLSKSKIAEEKFKVFYNKLIHSASCINLNLKGKNEFFHLITTNTSQKQDVLKKFDIVTSLNSTVKMFISKIGNLNPFIVNYKNACKNILRENIELLIHRVHCSRDGNNLDKNICNAYQCCHNSTRIFSNIHSISSFNTGNCREFESQNLYKLLIRLHNEFNKAYSESVDNPQHSFRSSLLPVNNTNWTLTLGDTYYSRFEGPNQLHGLVNPADDIDPNHLKRYLRKLYDENIKLVRNCLRNIAIPILLISSLDNSLYGIHDIDVYEPIRNSNILHVVTQSGGDCTYLSGTIPSYWLKDPLLEFIQAAIANSQEAIFT